MESLYRCVFIDLSSKIAIMKGGDSRRKRRVSSAISGKSLSDAAFVKILT